MSIFSKLWDGLKWFGRLFKSKAAQDIFKSILEKILPEAIPIVEQIRKLVGSPKDVTVRDIKALYEDFRLIIPEIVDTAEGRGNALLNLATAELKLRLGDDWKDVSTANLHSAIELALSGLKAEE